MKIRIWHVILFVCTLTVFAAATTPASYLIPQRVGVLTYSRISGTMWGGRLTGARLLGMPVENLSWRAQPLQLFTGAVAVAVRGDGGLDGELVSRRTFSGNSLSAKTLRLESVPLGDKILRGTTEVHNLDVEFVQGQCVRGSGAITSDVLSAAGASMQLEAPQLTGDIACEGKEAVLRAHGIGSKADRVSGELRLAANGEGTWQIAVETTNSETRLSLVAAGFQDSGGPRLTRQGAVKWTY